MPNLDGTGPEGKGPMTGRRRGKCRDSEKNRDQNKNEYGMGRGRRGRGSFGRGRRRGFDNSDFNEE